LRRSAASRLERGRDLENVAGNVNCSFMSNTGATCDVAVVGGGPAGLSAAIALAQAGSNTALIAPRSPYADNRTTALLGGSIDFLESAAATGRHRFRRCGWSTTPLA
jgi:2-octaprenyl-6-methoxyphenol hydroxylase